MTIMKSIWSSELCCSIIHSLFIHSDVIIKGKEGEPVIEWTKFGWIIHGEAEGITDMCLFTKSSESEYRELYSWDILGLKDPDLPDKPKLLGLNWDKRKDTLTFTFNKETKPVTKRDVFHTVNSIYDPFGLIEPLRIFGKHLYREACDLERC